ncbi:MAG TPA: hypothetical protein [Caudoviricetes sp.]|jgi:hypothetical protein|nr:MAG TPA: hypothetical protein [Caudoviricetes sp.]
MKAMAVCDFFLAALWLVNFIIGCVNVANGQPFANNVSIACAYLLVILAFINLGFDNLRER